MEPPVIQPDPIRPTRIEYPVSPRLQRIRSMSYLLDQSIRLPGGYRIGIDPLIGLLPGLGDIIAAGLSTYLIYQAARMGLSKGTLLKMCRNVVIETVVGEIPILGDIFDMTWKANVRNAQLVEKFYKPGTPERSRRKVMGFILLVFFAISALAIGLMVFYVFMILKLFSMVFGL